MTSMAPARCGVTEARAVAAATVPDCEERREGRRSG
jgi:hypothetical protein